MMYRIIGKLDNKKENTKNYCTFFQKCAFFDKFFLTLQPD